MGIWNKDYAPHKLSEIPHPQVTSILKQAAKNKRAILIHGPTGVGKTTIAHVLAKEENYEILEINASDTRDKEQIESIIGASTSQMSLFNKEKIILIDEVDSIAGQEDRGGVQALANLIPKSQHAIILTANDIEDERLKPLKKLVTIIELGKINHQFIKSILKDICEKEKITFEETHLDEIAKLSAGDIRAAINDLQTHTDKNNKLDLSEIVSRDAEESIAKILSVVFKTNNIYDSMNSMDRTEESLDEIFLWIDYNIPKEYRRIEDISKAYEALSKADIFRGRIKRQQHWRFLVYQKALMSAGVTKAKSIYNPTFTKYERTSRLLKIWMANRKYAQRKEIAAKLAKKTHTSTKDIINNFGLYKQILKSERIQKELKLKEEEIEFIKE